MSSYARYKKWWIEHEAPHNIPSLYYGDTPEIAFRQHVGEMNSYELMETLEDWKEEEDTDLQGMTREELLGQIMYLRKKLSLLEEPASLTKLLNDMVEKFQKQHNYPPMEQTPSFPRPHIPYNPLFPTVSQTKPQCSKCGMYLDKVMGYVCGDNHCPTFMKATC
jgi:hypothetical protein